MALSHPDTNDTSHSIIGAAIAVHRELGPGLLESIYEECLYFELLDSGLSVARQRPIPIKYKSHQIDGAYRPDLIVEEQVIVEAKSIEKVLPVHKSQVLTYLKITRIRVGLLINFNVSVLVDGITRISL